VLLDERAHVDEVGDFDRWLQHDAQVLDVLDPRVPEAALLRAVDVRPEQIDAAQREVLGLCSRQAELRVAAWHSARLALGDVDLAQRAHTDVAGGSGN